MNTDPGCPFCEYREKVKVYHEYTRHGVVRAIPIDPVTPGHEIFFPMSHIDEPGSDWSSMVEATFFLAFNFAEGVYDNYNIIVNQGVEATQTIDHLHVHMVPRRKNDGLILPWTAQHRTDGPQA